MNIAVVIVNYRTADLVCQSLDALAAEVAAGVPLRAHVGDAASGDGSAARIAAHIAARGYGWADSFEIGRNGGFAHGNNAILDRHVRPDPGVAFVHFLNPDAMVRPGAVTALARFLAATPAAGVAGSRLENPDGSPRAAAFRFPTPWREFFRGARFGALERLIPQGRGYLTELDRPTRVDWVSGASFMMPRAVLDRVGPMDDGYFLYFEETDLMARVARAGFEVWHVPDSRVVHLAGQATGQQVGAGEARLPAHWFRSRARYFQRHHGRAGLMLGTGLYLAGDIVLRLRSLILLRRPQTAPALWRDHLRHALGSRDFDRPGGGHA